jgi:hypothetical protein
MPSQPPSAEIGDLVVCPDEQYRSNHLLPDETGLVIALRRKEAKVFFPCVFGESWIPGHHLARIKNPAASSTVPTWMQRIWFLAKTLPTVALQVEKFGEEGCAVRIFHGEIDATAVDEVRHGLGEELRYYSIAPAGLRKMEACIAFVSSDRMAAPVPPVAPE